MYSKKVAPRVLSFKKTYGVYIDSTGKNIALEMYADTNAVKYFKQQIDRAKKVKEITEYIIANRGRLPKGYDDNNPLVKEALKGNSTADALRDNLINYVNARKGKK